MGTSRSTEIYLIDLEQDKKIQACDQNKEEKLMLDYPIFYDLKTFSDIDKSVKIMKIEVHCLRTNIIFLGTSNGLYILNLNAYLLPKFHTNPNFKALAPL
jgi:hypothetical protein